MSGVLARPPLAFALPPAQEATAPPEARGLARDQVRLLVSAGETPSLEHARFRALSRFLRRGDLLVVNVSATIPAALDAWRSGERIALHVSSPHPERGWIVELRQRDERTTSPLRDARAGERIRLPGGAEAVLLTSAGTRFQTPHSLTSAGTRFQTPHSRLFGAAPDAIRPSVRPPAWPTGSSGHRLWNVEPGPPSVRLWQADVRGAGDMLSYLARYGAPIRYGYVRRPWPLEYYQTIFASEPGSAEMPSAGRAFSRDLVARLEGCGVRFAPIVLHTGVASLEADEAPYPERFGVPASTARAVNDTRDAGGRVIAVGTTVVRALETVVAPDGRVAGAAGWTDVVVTPERGVRSIDGLITGFHEPRASHLAMLEALAGPAHLAAAYEAALDEGYLWHEFGDAHLLLTSSTTSTGRWSDADRSSSTTDSSTRMRDAGRYRT